MQPSVRAMIFVFMLFIPPHIL